MAYLLALLLLHIFSIEAKDIGNYGITFDIKEDDLILVLKERLGKSQIDEQEQQKIQKAFTKSLEKPKGRSLPKALKLRSFYFDPTICLQEDLTDKDGKIIISKGFVVNPLDRVKLSENLLFFDGDDPQQLAWAITQKGKLILTSGSPLELEKNVARAIYFDQNGYLTKKLGIQALPAKVIQEDKKLKIEEIPCF